MTSLNTSRVGFQPASAHHEELMEIYIWPFVLVVIYTILGTIGNTLVLYVYIFRWKRTKVRIFLTMLGVLNFINSVFNMPVEAYILWHPLQFDNHWLCKMTRGVTFVINNVCACVFIAIAIDRLLIVYRPLRRLVLTCRYAKISCFVAFVIGFATSWPGFFLYGTATLPERLDEVIVIGKTCYLADEYLQKKRYASIFNTILFVLMLTVFIILIVLYIFIGRKLYLVTKPELSDMRNKSKQLSKNPSIFQKVRSLVVKSVISEDGVEDPNGSDVNKNEMECFKIVQSKKGPETLKSKSKPKPLPHSPNQCVPNLSRRFSSANSDAARGNTITMLMITVAFVLCFLPYLVIVSLRYTNETLYNTIPKSNRIAYHVFLRTYFLNSVVNPFIYSFFNKTFKDIVISSVRTLVDRVMFFRRRASPVHRLSV